MGDEWTRQPVAQREREEREGGEWDGMARRAGDALWSSVRPSVRPAPEPSRRASQAGVDRSSAAPRQAHATHVDPCVLTARPLDRPPRPTKHNHRHRLLSYHQHRSLDSVSQSDVTV